MTTTGEFRYLDASSLSPTTKPWSKVDGGGTSYTLSSHSYPVANLREHLPTDPSEPTAGKFGADIDVAGFAVYHAPANEKSFTDDTAVRTGYYAEIASLLRSKLPGKISHIEIFDHTIRRHDPSAPRQPVQLVHVDQTPAAAEARVRRHIKLPSAEVDALLRKRYQLINVWRPISHPASDFPLAVIDWRTTKPADLVPVDLLYPLANRQAGDDDDRGKEALPQKIDSSSTEGYEVKGETYGVLPNEAHKFYYVKDMTPDEAMFIKCFDSWAEGKPQGRKGVAALTPHTAFVDPATPEGAKGRESIEVRCLVFYEE